MQGERALEGVAETFASTSLHDWQLLEIVVRYTRENDYAGGHEVAMRILEPERLGSEDDPLKEYWLVFTKVRGIRGELDLVAKTFCSDMISSKSTKPVSEDPLFVDRLDETLSTQLTPNVPSRDNLKRFHFWLIPPAGEIELLAETVTMTEIVRRKVQAGVDPMPDSA